ncbi:hypothetical protein L1049_013785 [Liquidambar formosana]|uniref:S-protein homolog n=1 Tax=Liquidambar formosana TaxID=63359 RepID=A0AAP0RPV4_LIQFO
MGTFGFNNRSLVVFVLVALSFRQYSQVSGLLLSKVRVTLINQLESEQSLTLHCRSKDDDLGRHVIPFMHAYEWKFYVNFWGTTLFWCNFWWRDADGTLIDGSFKIYEYERDEDICFNMCVWGIHENGLLLYHKFVDKWEKLYRWPMPEKRRRRKRIP